MWPNDHGQYAIEKGLDAYDFIIIGAGSAGSVVANRLSEIPEWKVLLLEAGGDPPAESEIPAMAPMLINTTYSWNYHIEFSEKAGKLRPKGILMASGKMLGGSSSMNFMLYHRGHPSDYDAWKNLGNPTWEWKNVLDYFKKSQDMVTIIEGEDQQFHGHGGLMKTVVMNSTDFIIDKIIQGIKHLKYKLTNGTNYYNQNDFRFTTRNLYKGQRFSAARAFLNSAKDRPNLHIIKNAFATKILIEDKNWATGVEFEVTTKGGVKKMTAKATKEVISSAGTVNSAKLLQLSGIGRPELLSQFGIPVKKDAAVGYNLQNHITVPFFITHKPIKPSDPEKLKQSRSDQYFQFLFNRSGTFASMMGNFDVIGVINTQNRVSDTPDVQYDFFKFNQGTKDFHEFGRRIEFPIDQLNALVKANKDLDIYLIFVTLLVQTDRGRVEIQSNNPHQVPKIVGNFLKSTQDVKTLVKGIQNFRKILRTPMFRDVNVNEARFENEECSRWKYGSDEFWSCYVKYLSMVMYHPVGTVKMGPDSDKEAVVDYRLKVKGIDGLRVIDASIMPIIPRGNTNAPTIMIGEKASDFIKEDWKSVLKDEL